MGAPIIDDELWALIEPLLPLPKPRRKKYPGRLPVSNRAALNGILFVFKTGMRWCDLSTKLGFGSGPTCWRRLRDWQRAGVWSALHALLLAKLRIPANVTADSVIVTDCAWNGVTRSDCRGSGHDGSIFISFSGVLTAPWRSESPLRVKR